MFKRNKVVLAVIAVAAIQAMLFAGRAAAAPVAAGQKAPDFTLPTHDGKSLTLSKLEGKRGVVLDFFATWCPPCIRGVPHMKSFVEATRDKNVLVYGINIKQSREIVERFVKTRRINYRILLDSDAAVAKKYGVVGIPFIVGIDAAGVIRYAGHSLPKDRDAFVKTLTASLAGQTGRAVKPAPTKARVSFITKETLQDWMKRPDDLVVVDVLGKASYNRAHIKGAINIPLTDLDRQAGQLLDKDQRVVVYCASYQCHASTEAAKTLMALGFKDVHDYKGGIAEWAKAGLPTEKVN